MKEFDPLHPTIIIILIASVFSLLGATTMKIIMADSIRTRSEIIKAQHLEIQDLRDQILEHHLFRRFINEECGNGGAGGHGGEHVF